jgi:hypothetical protein
MKSPLPDPGEGFFDPRGRPTMRHRPHRHTATRPARLDMTSFSGPRSKSGQSVLGRAEPLERRRTWPSSGPDRGPSAARDRWRTAGASPAQPYWSVAKESGPSVTSASGRSAAEGGRASNTRPQAGVRRTSAWPASRRNDIRKRDPTNVRSARHGRRVADVRRSCLPGDTSYFLRGVGSSSPLAKGLPCGGCSCPGCRGGGAR